MSSSVDQSERRRHRRLDVRLPLAYGRAEASEGRMSRTTTVNVSTGGLYFETTAEDFAAGDELTFDISPPDSEGRFPPDARVSARGRVVRTDSLENATEGEGSACVGVAAAFAEPLKLAF